MESNLVELCGLWKKQSKSGNTYLAGRIKENTEIQNNMKVLVFRNQHKEEGSNQPDYRVMIAPYEEDRAPRTPPPEELEF